MRKRTFRRRPRLFQNPQEARLFGPLPRGPLDSAVGQRAILSRPAVQTPQTPQKRPRRTLCGPVFGGQTRARLRVSRQSTHSKWTAAECEPRSKRGPSVTRRRSGPCLWGLPRLRERPLRPEYAAAATQTRRAKGQMGVAPARGRSPEAVYRAPVGGKISESDAGHLSDIAKERASPSGALYCLWKMETVASGPLGGGCVAPSFEGAFRDRADSVR